MAAPTTQPATPPGDTPQATWPPPAAATYQPQPPPATPTSAAPTPTATPRAATAGRTPFEPCSPLKDIRRVDLTRLVSAPYAPPPPGSDARHQGVDFAFYNWKGHRQTAGTVVQAILPGRTAAALNGTFPYGNLVIIETPAEILPPDLSAQLDPPAGYSLYHLYAHLEDDSMTVRLGDEVASCQALGAVGKSGNTLAAHLHLEIRIGPAGQSFPAMSAFTQEATLEEKQAYRLWRISWVFQHFDPMRLLGYGFTSWVTPTPTARNSRP